MEYLLVIIVCIYNFKRVDYQVLGPLVADIVAALSLIGLTTSTMGLISSLFKILGWISEDTIIGIATYIALRIPLIASILAGFIIIYHEFQLDNKVRRLIEVVRDKIRKKNLIVKKSM